MSLLLAVLLNPGIKQLFVLKHFWVGTLHNTNVQNIILFIIYQPTFLHFLN